MNSPGSASRAPAWHSALQRVAQNHGRAVAGDFDHVFGGVGTRRGEVRDHDLIDSVAVCIGQARRASPTTASRLAQLAGNRRMRSAIARASGPEIRMMPMPPRPGGVETAAIVSLECITPGIYSEGR